MGFLNWLVGILKLVLARMVGELKDPHKSLFKNMMEVTCWQSEKLLKLGSWLTDV